MLTVGLSDAKTNYDHVAWANEKARNAPLDTPSAER
jgi:hypothetical protein